MFYKGPWGPLVRWKVSPMFYKGPWVPPLGHYNMDPYPWAIIGLPLGHYRPTPWALYPSVGRYVFTPGPL